MTRTFVAAAVIALAACGHKKPEGGKTSDAGPPPLIKSVAVSFESQQDGDVSHVFLPAMDETGKVINYPIGDFPGTCASIPPDGADLVTLECKATAGTVRLHAIKQNQDVVVLKETIAPGASPDPMNRDELQRFTMPIDAKIEAGK
ncbi:MAG TPA: hypothetical protein VL463_02145 [Kofleriaceae bacterium]|nr:hypothetical protein [Kofleriaceae bacterium]